MVKLKNQEILTEEAAYALPPRYYVLPTGIVRTDDPCGVYDSQAGPFLSLREAKEWRRLRTAKAVQRLEEQITSNLSAYCEEGPSEWTVWENGYPTPRTKWSWWWGGGEFQSRKAALEFAKTYSARLSVRNKILFAWRNSEFSMRRDDAMYVASSL